jgi:hypothetical protein
MKVKGRLTALVCASALWTGLSAAQNVDVKSVVTAPGGSASYHVENADSPSERIVQCTKQCANKRVIVMGKAGQKPEQNLFGFENLRLSPDASTLYFETAAWAVSNAVHAVNLKTGVARFVTDGSIACVVGSGEHQGDIIVAQHKYFVQGGSYDPLNLFTPEGKQVGVVALDSADAPRFCAPKDKL